MGQRDQHRVRGRTREESSGSAGGSVAARHSRQTTCARDLFEHRRQDVYHTYLLGADLSSGCAILRVLHEEILSNTAALHKRFAKPVPCLSRQNKVVVEAETAAGRSQGVAGGRKLAIQGNSDTILEASQWHQRPQQCARNHRAACAERSTLQSNSKPPAGGDGRRHSSQRQLGWATTKCAQGDDSLETALHKHLFSWR